MSRSDVSALERSFQKAHEWLEELREEGRFDNRSQAYAALRSVLHTLRDRLTVHVCANLAAQLPMVVRGIYYEGWKPEAVPIKYRTRRELFAAVEKELAGSNVPAEHACRTVFALLARNLSPGELDAVRQQLPAELRALWGSPRADEDAREREAETDTEVGAGERA